MTPAVIIGVGGFGCSIAAGVRERLTEFARARQNPEHHLQELERQVRFVAIDTNRFSSAMKNFTQAEQMVFSPPSPDALIQQRQGLLKEWWPDHIQAVGPFVTGAGGMRAKSRLAYFLHGDAVSSKVQQLVSQIRASSVANMGSFTGSAGQMVYVYLVGSLSGGTGSGMLLTAAMHLRNELDNDVRTIGVIPLPGIMQLGPGSAQQDMVYANCAAGLRELDWWMTPPNKRIATISPFFKAGLQEIPDRMTGGRRAEPFDLCYLFGAQNRLGKPLADYDSYIDLIADCVAGDLDSPASFGAQSLISNVLGAMDLAPSAPDLDSYKSARFAGAGAASIIFSVAQTAQYLGDVTLLGALRDRVLIRRDAGDEARLWLNDHQLLTNQGGQLHQRLQRQRVNERTGAPQMVRAVPNLDLSSDGVSQGNVAGVINNALNAFTQNRLRDLVEICPANAQDITNEAMQDLRTDIESLIDDTQGDGVARATDLLRSIQGLLDVQIGDAGQWLDGAGVNPGARQNLTMLTNRRDSAIAQLQNQMKPGLLRRGRPQDATRGFMSQFWTQYVTASEQVVLRESERDLLITLRSRIAQLHERFTRALLHIQERTQAMTLALDAHFGRTRGAMAYEDRVLASASLVKSVFSDLIQRHQLDDSETVNRLAHRLSEPDSYLRGWLLSTERGGTVDALALGVLDTAVAADLAQGRRLAERLYRPALEKISVWEAMEREFYARVATNEPDSIMLNSLQTGDGTTQFARSQINQYMAARIEQCISSSQPHLELDQVGTVNFQSHFSVPLMAQPTFSWQPFEDGNLSPTMSTLAANLRNSISHMASADTQDQSIHHFMVSQRQYGMPLFMMSASEQRQMLQHEDTWRRQKGHTYIDERFVGVLPDDLTVATLDRLRKQRLSERIAHASTFVMALSMEFIRFTDADSDRGESGIDGPIDYANTTRKSKYHHLAASMEEALLELQTNGAVHDGVRGLALDEWKPLRTNDRNGRLDKLDDWIEDRLQDDGAGFGTARRSTLELLQTAVSSLR